MIDLQRFIWEYREDDPAQLALSAKKYPGLSMSFVASQVEALQKIRRKIPSWYREGLQFPVALSLEQASSEATARFKAALVSGASMADLTGGLGVDASFFARQFSAVTFVEKVPEIALAAQHNLGLLGLRNIAFFQGLAEDFLAQCPGGLDLIYLDPARRDDRKGKVFHFADCTPNILEIRALLLTLAPKVLVKAAPFLDIRLAAEQLGAVSAIWVLENEGDCREVLYLLEKEPPPLNEIPIRAVTLGATVSGVRTFEFTLAMEQAAEVSYSLPLNYLYEPSPAVMKTGAFKSFAQQFGLFKLHPNTQLYTSVSLISGLPARAFRIEAVGKYDKKTVENLIPGKQANISTRNFPDNSEAVRKKLGLKDGGNVYVFAATVQDEKKQIMICSRV